MTGSTALVVGVGAEQGLGAALCRHFAAEGHHVLAAGRTAHRLARVVRGIAAAGGSAEAVVADATCEDQVARLLDRAMAPGEGLAPVDLVAFNAGNNRRAQFRELEASLFEELWRVGCFAGFLVGREAARRLAPLGRGTIIFTGASASLRGRPGFAGRLGARGRSAAVQGTLLRQPTMATATLAGDAAPAR
jgi:NAD(P)-dependent dehydrogenase (short-subunit alcohol dehydrogenase family)